ncbi:hypothetical protein [Mucilaginibacter ginsenosidivorans]|uniref:Uncharacterized protein n=1 Tax=Mucilaginibacter ginsenosidivorans TaxID=398053 RepID=A0A5B8UW32_9SPHI|nr:hypothetical protein [Mucilaginibacter ginsenosidivorans]QEC63337.1 hypothetical protein FRZ54_12380 [Mucilaginibacter ginsenosidivorans]
MKKVVGYLFLAITLGCNQSQPKRTPAESISNEAVKEAVKSEDTLQAIINANIRKQPTTDTVFLGFIFGMTRKDVNSHVNLLIKEKKLFINEDDQRYEYRLSLGLIKANASIAPDYKDNKLYKLTLIITPTDDIITEDLVYQQTALLYMKKYTSFDFFKEPDLINTNNPQYHWIKNNLHIYQHKTIEGTIVSYINMPVEQALDQKGKADADSAKLSTQKDI